MAITLTTLRSGRGFQGNDKEIVYEVALTAEPYTTGGIVLNSVSHLIDSDDNKEFESIDYAEVINSPHIANEAVYNAIEDNAVTTNPKVKIQRANFAGTETPNETALTEMFDLKVVGVPLNAPGGVNR